MAQDVSLEWWRPARSADAAPSDTGPHWVPVQGSLPYWAMMVFTGILLFSPQNYFPFLAPLRPALLVIAVGLLVYVGDRWGRGLPLFEWHRELRLVALLIGLGAVTLPFSLWPGGSLSVLFDFVKTGLVFVLLSHVIGTKERLCMTAWLLTFMAVGLGLFALYNYLSGTVIDQGVNQDRLVGNEGALTKNPNDLALMVNLLLPVTVGLYLGARQAWHRLVLSAAIGMEVLTVVLTYSRAGAVTLAAIFAAYVWKLRGRRERSVLYALLFAGLLALPLLPSSYFERLSTITNIQADRTGSAQERLSDMIVASKTVLANPLLGAGLGMNMLAMREARGGWLRVHNVYLEHAIDLGLPGLALFLALLVSCIRAMGTVQRHTASTPDLRALAEGLQISLLAYAVAGMFHPVSYQYYFYYFAGLALAAKRIAAMPAVRPVDHP